MQMKQSVVGCDFIEGFEGLSLTSYQDAAGVWTIGYGHTGRGVGAGMKITHEQAASLLCLDVEAAVEAVNKLVTVGLTQNEFDALVDFTFNLGVGSLMHSTLLREVNAGNKAAAAGEFEAWDHVGGRVSPGLLRRRQAEAALFTTV